METIVVDIPSMYGDHHAAAVHQCVAGLPGVQGVLASAASRKLQVTFDPNTISFETILEQLARSGHPVQDGQQEATLSGPPETVMSQSTIRMTQTNPVDL